MTKKKMPVAPEGHDFDRDAKFWNQLHGAMLDTGDDFNKRYEKEPEGCARFLGDWLSALRQYFREHGWKNAERIYGEHLIAVAKAAPEFEIVGDGSLATPTRLRKKR